MFVSRSGETPSPCRIHTSCLDRALNLGNPFCLVSKPLEEGWSWPIEAGRENWACNLPRGLSILNSDPLAVTTFQATSR